MTCNLRRIKGTNQIRTPPTHHQRIFSEFNKCKEEALSSNVHKRLEFTDKAVEDIFNEIDKIDQGDDPISPEHVEFERIEDSNINIGDPRIFQLLKQVHQQDMTNL